MKIFFNRIFYRAATTPITIATTGATYPNYTFSGWSPLQGVRGVAKIGKEPDGEEPADGGQTQLASGEQIPVEIEITGFTAAEYATIRTAFLNVKNDVMLYDADQPLLAYAIHGIRLYPTPNWESAAEPKIVLKGTRKHGAGATDPLALVTVTVG